MSEFTPHKQGDKPLTTSGHQVGQQVGNDAAPEFHAKVLPAGSAPAANTFKPNPENEVPGQADNTEAMNRSHGKESTYSDPMDMPGAATSKSVHTPIGGATSDDASKGLGQGVVGGKDITGGSGMQDGGSAESRRLETDKTDHGPNTVHNASKSGAEDVEPVRSEQL